MRILEFLVFLFLALKSLRPKEDARFVDTDSEEEDPYWTEKYRVYKSHYVLDREWFRMPKFYEAMPETSDQTRWWLENLSSNNRVVGGWIPQAYDAYVKLPYPPGRESFAPPFDGTMEALQTDSDETCICCLWEGYSSIQLRTTKISPDHHVYEYWVYTAPFGELASYLRTDANSSYVPVITWPEDQRWCLATPFSADRGFLGGTQELVDRMLTLPQATAIRSTDEMFPKRNAP